MLRTLLNALKMAIVAPLFVVFTIGLAATAIMAVFVAPRFVEPLIHLWSRVFLAGGPVRFTVIGQENAPADRVAVYVANHLSNFDIPLMFLAIPAPIRFLAKKELFSIPVFAEAMRRVGIVEVDRARAASLHEAINAAIARAVARGHSLIVFPEGTRSDSGKLRDFKKGAFRIAVDNELPVVPITIVGSWEAWRPGSKIAYPGRVRIVIHEPIETTGLGHPDLVSLRSRVHQTIGNAYRELRSSAATRTG